MAHDGNLLWLAAPDERLVAAHDPESGKTEARLSYAHEVWDVCPAEDGAWLLTAGGKLDRQIVFWSFREERETQSYGCPDGAGSGLALYDEKLWLPHRHNRKLFCIDPKSGKTNWVVRTQRETFSPAAYRNELWLVESDPGPLAHWSDPRHARYFFARYDPARSMMVSRACRCRSRRAAWRRKGRISGTPSSRKRESRGQRRSAAEPRQMSTSTPAFFSSALR